MIEQVYMNEIERSAKGHFFSKGAMKFFNCRLPQLGYRDMNGIYYFITSEKGPNDFRTYSIRSMDTKGYIHTLGDFNSYTTRSEADRALKKIFNNDRS